MSPTIRSNATILDPSLASNYSIHSTVSELLASLMVEEWQWTTKYDQYYEACHPTECQYTVVGRNDAIYIVTTVIGLMGGLMKVLKIVVPGSVRFARYMARGRQGASIRVAVVEPSDV